MAKLLDAATATGAGEAISTGPGFHSASAYGTATSSGSATVNIQGSNSGTEGTWLTIGTLTVTLASTLAAGVPDGMSAIAAWKYYRANCTAISGAGAALTVDLS
jgi:hypothetical protein